ncbi:MAG: hypothetical protein CME69_01475 [Halobacteriovorax sp.]|nr:hypothetical protein [Halobacteriovorax sp.]|tara:strand:- start:1097 stop:1309 length:213 start_codon:yes stop_codon:yes gene_type:complete
MSSVSKTLILIGIIFIIVGLFLHFGGSKLPLGKLPGDIRIENGNSKFYFPLTTSLLVSAVLSLLMYFFRK